MHASDLDSITFQSPGNSACTELNDYITFVWSGLKSNTAIERKYILEIVQINDGQTPDEAFASNPLFYSYISQTTTSNADSSHRINKLLPTSSELAWRVRAIRTDNAEPLAVSKTFIITGPPIINVLVTENNVINVLSTKGNFPTNFSGKGTSLFRDVKRLVYFDNITAGYKSRDYYLTSGYAYGTMHDSIDLKANKAEYGSARFYIDSLIIEPVESSIKGIFKHTNWNVLDSLINNTFRTSLHFYNGGTVTTVSHFPSITFSSKNAPNMLVTFDSLSNEIIVYGNGFTVHENGYVTIKYKLEDRTEQLIKVPFSGNASAKSIYSSKVFNSTDTLKINKYFSIIPKSATVDISNNQSPSIIGADTLWKGVVFDSFTLLCKSNDTTRTLDCRSFDITSDSVNYFTITKDSANYKITNNPIFCSSLFCGFESTFNKIKLSSNKSDSSYLSGKMFIPYLNFRSNFLFDINNDSILLDTVKNIVWPTPNSAKLFEFYITYNNQKYYGEINEESSTITLTWPGIDSLFPKTHPTVYFKTNGTRIFTHDKYSYSYNIIRNKELDIRKVDSVKIYSINNKAHAYAFKSLSTSISKSTECNKVKIYPNPASNKIIINGLNGKSAIFIVSSNGQNIFSKQTNNDQECIDISNLAKGVYFVRIQSDNQINTSIVVKH
jgi:hypothetical protein